MNKGADTESPKIIGLMIMSLDGDVQFCLVYISRVIEDAP